MNSEVVSALIAKKPALKVARAKLEAMEPGAYCTHQSWGFGQISAYDEATQKLTIDFKDKPGHKMDPTFCATTMEILPANHILVRNQTEAAHVKEMIEKDPAQLVVETLQAYENNATTGLDLEINLSQVVGEAKFKKWWAAAKKVVAKDPRIAAPVKKNEVYLLREKPVEVEAEIIEQFTGTRSARRRIALAEKLVAAADSKELKVDMDAVLEGLTEGVRDSNQLEPAERLYGAFIRDALAKIMGVDGSVLAPSQAELIAEPRDLPDIADSIPVHFQRTFLRLVYDAHPIECRDIIFNLLKTSQGKFTTECINFLMENEYAEDLATTLHRWQIEQNLRAPVLLWIVKNRHSKKFAGLLHDLITPRLLSAVFFAIDYEALQSATTRRIPLADILSEDTELIPDLLATADPETARDLANTLMLNQGFEELTKKSLLARFIKLFPGIQSLVAADGEAKEEALIVSRSSFERRRAEYDEIVSKKIPENSRAIATAREHGDLKENSEYKMAKQDQSLLMAQKTELERDLARARISDFQEASPELIGVGTIVTLKDIAADETVTYHVMGAWDSDPENNVIAYKTPLGQALLSKRTGEQITVKIGTTEDQYEIIKIQRFVDLVTA